MNWLSADGGSAFQRSLSAIGMMTSLMSGLPSRDTWRHGPLLWMAPEAVRTVVEAGPDIFNHNTETVPRLYPRIRPKAVYANSLALLRHVKALAPEMVTKSGLMVGLGETEDELVEVFRNMRAHDIDVLTVGQYLRPSRQHAEVARYYRPEEFARLKELALEMGFGHVESGALVRSSYHADEQVPAPRKNLLAG